MVSVGGRFESSVGDKDIGVWCSMVSMLVSKTKGMGSNPVTPAKVLYIYLKYDKKYFYYII